MYIIRIYYNIIPCVHELRAIIVSNSCFEFRPVWGILYKRRAKTMPQQPQLETCRRQRCNQSGMMLAVDEFLPTAFPVQFISEIWRDVWWAKWCLHNENASAATLQLFDPRQTTITLKMTRRRRFIVSYHILLSGILRWYNKNCSWVTAMSWAMRPRFKDHQKIASAPRRSGDRIFDVACMQST